jgi:hypothetical protein
LFSCFIAQNHRAITSKLLLKEVKCRMCWSKVYHRSSSRKFAPFI